MYRKNNILQLPLGDISEPIQTTELKSSNQKTAKEAIKILLKKDAHSYKDLTPKEKKNLIIAFASKDKIIYGKAFDIVKIDQDIIVDFSDQKDIVSKIKHIVICEIKSTSKQTKRKNFDGYFFGLTTAELLVAQNLKNNYKFIFVNVNTNDVIELTLKQIFEKAKGIYPQWSILF